MSTSTMAGRYALLPATEWPATLCPEVPRGGWDPLGDDPLADGPHIIRLRGPWRPQVAAAPRHIQMRRVFGRPTGLGPSSRVTLTVQQPVVPFRLSLNGERLASSSVEDTLTRYEICDLLRERNELVVHVDLPPAAATDAVREQLHHGLRVKGWVWLEITGHEKTARS